MLNQGIGSAVGSGNLGGYANDCQRQPINTTEITDAMARIREQLNMVQDSLQQVRIRLEPVCELLQPSVTSAGGLIPSPTRRSMLGTTLYNYADEIEGLNIQLHALLQSIAL